MNNTTTKRNLAIAAIFIAATLVVGTVVVTTTIATTAFAYSPKKDNKRDAKDGGNGNGNTITIQKCKQAATQSGWDNNQGQECENLICTHPGENATCVQEGTAAVAQTPTTTSLRIIKKVVCQNTDPNCFPNNCQIVLFTSFQGSRGFECQSAVGNGVVVTLQPGDRFSVGESQTGGPFFEVDISGDCEDVTIAAGQHLTCTVTNTEPGI
jgi:hypothetical protein